MDDKQVAKEMLKDFISTHSTNLRPHRCPFVKKYKGIKLQHHDLCAVVFPGWGRYRRNRPVGRSSECRPRRGCERVGTG